MTYTIKPLGCDPKRLKDRTDVKLVQTTFMGEPVKPDEGMAALIASAFWNSVGRMRMRGQGALIVLAIGIVFTLIAFLVGPLMQLALSRQRESLADVSGVELTRNPAGLISALQKIASNDKPPERFNHAVAAMMIDNPEEHHGSFFSRLFDTHPPIAERIAALQRVAGVQQT